MTENSAHDARTVLVVDDDPGIREYVQNLLALSGYRVETAPGGAEALARLDAGMEPGVVILDIMMPGMDGMETLAKVRDKDPELPVIMLSGIGQTAVVVKAMKAGAYDYIDKSFEADELEMAVERPWSDAVSCRRSGRSRPGFGSRRPRTPSWG